MKHFVQSESMLLLYLASQQKLYQPISEESFLSIQDSKNILKQKPQDQIITMQDIADFQKYYEREQKVYAQMTLGYRYNMGVGGVDLKCRSSVMYYEPAAYLTT